MCLVERTEPMLVQSLVSKPAIERLDHCFTPFVWRPTDPKLLEMNSGPLPTRIVCGLPRREVTCSKTRTTSSRVNRPS